VDGIPEEIIQKQVGQVGVLVVGSLDIAQEDGPVVHFINISCE
jgi:hypothetical protein